MRRSYAAGGLRRDALAPTWLEQFELWLADAVEAGVVEPNAMVFATADAEGRPSARTVLLKGVDSRGFTLYTNLRSRKGAEAQANPHGSLVFGWIEMGRQVVITGSIERVPDADADAYWVTRPRGSQLGAHASAQSSVIDGREPLEAAFQAAAARWPEGTPIPRPAHWSGLLVVPDAVEFWQGRSDRLHDRLRYRADGDVWTVERLAP